MDTCILAETSSLRLFVDKSGYEFRGRSRYFCYFCERRFSSNEELTEHDCADSLPDSHNFSASICPGELYECSKCNEEFRSESELYEHSQLFSKIKQTTVSYEKVLAKKPKVKKDIKNDLKCQFCNKVLSTKGNLKTHSLIHLKIKPYKCHSCDKTFAQFGNIDTHLKTHFNIKPHVCNTCGKRFTQKINLNVHELIHLEIKPYQCKICGRNFRQRSHIDKHLRTCKKKSSKNKLPQSLKSKCTSKKQGKSRSCNKICSQNVEESSNKDKISYNSDSNITYAEAALNFGLPDIHAKSSKNKLPQDLKSNCTSKKQGKSRSCNKICPQNIKDTSNENEIPDDPNSNISYASVALKSNLLDIDTSSKNLSSNEICLRNGEDSSNKGKIAGDIDASSKNHSSNEIYLRNVEDSSNEDEIPDDSNSNIFYTSAALKFGLPDINDNSKQGKNRSSNEIFPRNGEDLSNKDKIADDIDASSKNYSSNEIYPRNLEDSSNEDEIPDDPNSNISYAPDALKFNLPDIDNSSKKQGKNHSSNGICVQNGKDSSNQDEISDDPNSNISYSPAALKFNLPDIDNSSKKQGKNHSSNQICVQNGKDTSNQDKMLDDLNLNVSHASATLKLNLPVTDVSSDCQYDDNISKVCLKDNIIVEKDPRYFLRNEISSDLETDFKSNSSVPQNYELTFTEQWHNAAEKSCIENKQNLIDEKELHFADNLGINCTSSQKSDSFIDGKNIHSPFALNNSENSLTALENLLRERRWKEKEKKRSNIPNEQNCTVQ